MGSSLGYQVTGHRCCDLPPGGTFVYLCFLCDLPIFTYLKQRELTSSRQVFMCTVDGDEGPGGSIDPAAHPSPAALSNSTAPSEPDSPPGSSLP